MKYFSFPLVKENLKRFWGFSAIAFAAYFLTSNFIMLLNGGISTVSRMYDAITMMSGSYIPFSMFDVCVPIIASVLVFGYLTKVNSNSVMHSMPFSRASLYISNYVSGLILSFVPVILNALLTLALRNGLCHEIVYKESIVDPAAAFTAGLILRGLLLDLLTVFFTYSIASIAAIMSGNSIIHLLTAFTINFIFPVTWFSFVAYQYLMIDGYSSGSYVGEVAIAMHPGFKAYSGAIFGIASKMSPSAYIIYVIVALLLAMVGYLLYSKRKLERAGDSYVFGWVKYIVAFFFTYLPATGMAMLLNELTDGSFVLGLIIGAVLGFVIGWMIINKSFRIINIKALKAFAISAGITVIIAVIFAFDLTGYAKRIPNANNVDFAEFHYYSDGFFHAQVYDKENIQRIGRFHNEVADRDKSYHGYGDVRISYVMKDGHEINRYYTNVPQELFENSEDIKELFESDELDKDVDELNALDASMSTIEIQSEYRSVNLYDENEYTDEGTADYKLPPESLKRPLFLFNRYEDIELKQEIIDALAADLRDVTFDEKLNPPGNLGYVYIQCIDQPAPPERGTYVNSYSFSDDRKTYTLESTIYFDEGFENLLSVFEKYGMLDQIMAEAELMK